MTIYLAKPCLSICLTEFTIFLFLHILSNVYLPAICGTFSVIPLRCPDTWRHILARCRLLVIGLVSGLSALVEIFSSDQQKIRKKYIKHVYIQKNCYPYLSHSLALCLLGNLICIFVNCPFFQLFHKFFRNTIRVLNTLDPDQAHILSDLISFQTVCKRYP